MKFFNLLRQRNGLVRELLSEEAASNFVRSFYRQSDESPFKVGDTIHPERFGIPFGPFEVTGLKVGGQAVIYTVLADRRSSIFALKTFQNWCSRERGMFERFMREAEVMIDVGRHPSLLRAHAAFVMNGRPYLLLEYVAGANLRQKIKPEGLPSAEAVRYAIELCRGLAHAQKVLPSFIHRDIKPDNCLIASDGSLKIADFGQAKTTRQNKARASIAHRRKSRALSFGTKTTLADYWGAGTPEYMAPEQFHTNEEHDARTDVYSFGVTLFELLTGDVPFKADEYEELLELHRHSAPPDPRTLNSSTPPALSDLVMRCLAKSRDERPANFRELEQELDAIYRKIAGASWPARAVAEETAADIFNRGYSMLAFERYDEAIACFDRAISAGWAKTQTEIFQSVALAAKGRTGQAEEIIDQVLAEMPKNSAALNQKGLRLKERKLFREAIQYFDRAIAIDAKFVAAINHRAECQMALGHFDEALSTSRRSLTIEPLQNAAHKNLGEIYQRLNQREAAVDAYLKALEVDPRDLESLLQVTNELARAERLAEAVRYLERAIWLADGELTEDPVGAEMIAFLKSGFDDVRKLDGGDDSTLFRWFVAGASLHCLTPDAFCEALDEMIACLPRWRSWQRAELGKCLVEMLDRTESGYRANPVRHAIGRMFYELSRYDLARSVFQALLDANSDDAPALFYLGACAEKEGKRADALSLYRRALRYDPASPKVLEAIERLGAPLSLSARAVSAGSR